MLAMVCVCRPSWMHTILRLIGATTAPTLYIAQYMRLGLELFRLFGSESDGYPPLDIPLLAILVVDWNAS